MKYARHLLKTTGLSLLAAGVLPFLTTFEASAQVSDLINCEGRLVRSLAFVNRTRISGNESAVGSIYRYANVANGVDATVRIVSFSNGGSVVTIDRDNSPNNNPLPNNFQPEFNTTGTSLAQFEFSFFEAGTNTPISIDFAASPLDVDGNSTRPTQTGLRELVEFEDGFVQFARSNPTALVKNKNNGNQAGFTRFESDTDQFAPGIDETATQNIVTAFFTDTSTFQYVIGTVGNGTMTRLNSVGFNCPNLQNPITESEVDEDFGDAPLSNYGNPAHIIVAGVQIGATNTAETGPADVQNADADAGDDGVSFDTFVQGTSTEITVNVAGANGRLQGWIDWNDDGDFDEANEQIALNVQDTDSDGVITLNVPVPSDAVTTAAYGRFRWSTTQDLESNTSVSDGEVEDYLTDPILVASADLSAVKTVEIDDPENRGLYMTPGNRVIYRITVTNADSSTVAANNVDIVDTLPTDLKFLGATTTGFTGGAFGNPSLPPPNQDCGVTPCVISYENASIDVDATAEIIVTAVIK